MKHIYYIEAGTDVSGWHPYREHGFRNTDQMPTFSNRRSAAMYIKTLYAIDEIRKAEKQYYRIVDEIGTVYNDFRY